MYGCRYNCKELWLLRYVSFFLTLKRISNNHSNCLIWYAYERLKHREKREQKSLHRKVNKKQQELWGRRQKLSAIHQLHFNWDTFRYTWDYFIHYSFLFLLFGNEKSVCNLFFFCYSQTLNAISAEKVGFSILKSALHFTLCYGNFYFLHLHTHRTQQLCSLCLLIWWHSSWGRINN
jgi:hypothetical protein